MLSRMRLLLCAMSLPTLIRKRDGRLDRFQPEKISRSLFAITEELGSPDSFLAHELTDSVLHFLNGEGEWETTAELAELVIKVVRELGHPAIAKRFEESLGRVRSRTAASSRDKRQIHDLTLRVPIVDDYWIARDQFISHSLEHLYPRDLVAAHRDGMIELLDLDHPSNLSASILSPAAAMPLDRWDLFTTVREARNSTSWLVAIDGLEWSLSLQQPRSVEVARAYLEHLQRVLELNHLFAVVNLNCAEPPPWAECVTGPLFPASSAASQSGEIDEVANQVFEAYRPSPALSIDWHLSDRHLQPARQQRLERLIAKAIQNPRIAFVFDRPRQPIQLGPGLERGGPPVLSHLRLVLNRFVEMLGGGPLDPELYLRKLASLARFARTAGYVRQDYLRRFGAPLLQTGFTLERASLLVFHKGLIEAAMQVLGPSADELSIVELGTRSLQVIQSVLADGPLRAMSTRVSWLMTWDHPHGDEHSIFEQLGEGNQMWQRQLRHASRLGAIENNGILSICGNRLGPNSIQSSVEIIRAAWNTNVSRIRFGEPSSDKVS